MQCLNDRSCHLTTIKRSIERSTVQAAMSGSKIPAFLQDITDECAAHRDSIPAEPPARAFLFEGQLSQNELNTVRLRQHRLETLQH